MFVRFLWPGESDTLLKSAFFTLPALCTRFIVLLLSCNVFRRIDFLCFLAEVERTARASAANYLLSISSLSLSSRLPWSVNFSLPRSRERRLFLYDNSWLFAAFWSSYAPPFKIYESFYSAPPLPQATALVWGGASFFSLSCILYPSSSRPPTFFLDSVPPPGV